MTNQEIDYTSMKQAEKKAKEKDFQDTLERYVNKDIAIPKKQLKEMLETLEMLFCCSFGNNLFTYYCTERKNEIKNAMLKYLNYIK